MNFYKNLLIFIRNFETYIFCQRFVFVIIIFIKLLSELIYQIYHFEFFLDICFVFEIFGQFIVL